MRPHDPSEGDVASALRAASDMPVPPFAHLDRPAGPKARVLVLADVHADPDGEPGSWKCYERGLARLRRGLAEARRLDVDAVLVAGDLTRDAGAAAFDRVSNAFATFDGPVLCVPGNHDVPKAYRDAASVHAFRESHTPGVLPYARRVGVPETTADSGADRKATGAPPHVVGLDTASAVTDSAGGRVTDADLAWLDAAYDAACDAACDGSPRSRAVAANFADGYLDAFPLIDERVGSTGMSARPAADDR